MVPKLSRRRAGNWLALVPACCLQLACANQLVFTSPPAGGGNYAIPDALCSVPLDAFGNCSGTVTPQTVTSDIAISMPGVTVAAGDSVFVNLLAFQYLSAGDLGATVTFTPTIGAPVSVDLFNRIVTFPGDPANIGDGVLFGGPETGGGNYTFDPLAVNDLQTTAQGLGATDGIPDSVAYFPVTAGDVASSPSLNTAFTGMDISGTWTLSVTNYDPNGSGLPAPLGWTGNNFVGWQLSMAVDAPEPSYTALEALLGLAVFGWRWRARRARARPGRMNTA